MSAETSGAPSGLTIMDAFDAASDAGYTTQFHAVEGGEVRCDAGGHRVNPAALSAESVWRIEGASDAADMTIIAAVVCPRCDARGTLTLGYGPNTSAADEAVLHYLDLGGGARPGAVTT